MDLLSLPDDMLFDIFLYLDYHTILSMKQTCTDFCNFLSPHNHRFWITKLKVEGHDIRIINELLKFEKPYKLWVLVNNNNIISIEKSIYPCTDFYEEDISRWISTFDGKMKLDDVNLVDIRENLTDYIYDHTQEYNDIDQIYIKIYPGYLKLIILSHGNKEEVINHFNKILKEWEFEEEQESDEEGYYSEYHNMYKLGELTDELTFILTEPLSINYEPIYIDNDHFDENDVDQDVDQDVYHDD